MKIKILFKDPDGVYECIRDAVNESLPKGLTKQEQETLIEFRMETAREKLKKWIEYGETIDIEFDLDAGTATILENKS